MRPTIKPTKINMKKKLFSYTLLLIMGFILSPADLFSAETDLGSEPLSTPKKLHNWLSENVTYPATAAENNEQGTVYVSFTISDNGVIENATIVQGVTEALNKSALEIVSKMPVADLISGSEKFDTTYIVPIKFVIK